MNTYSDVIAGLAEKVLCLYETPSAVIMNGPIESPIGHQ